MRIGYLTGEYPRATDTFIQREVAALRELGVEVQTFAVRRPAKKENVGPEQESEQRRASYLLPVSLIELAKAHAALKLRSFPRWWRVLRLALQTRGPGLKATLYQLFYFAEAGVLAERLRQQNIEHLHNHFANSSCTVAMLAAELSGVGFSFTMHGPAIFFEPQRWRIDEKASRAKFVACISHFCRSQGMIFVPQPAWQRLHIVHCGVQPELIEPRQHAGQGRRLLFVGRVAAVKGLAVLIDALALLRERAIDVELSVVGDGPEREGLEAKAAALGLADRVRFLGYQNQAAVRQQLAETDVFVLPSFAEGVPVVLMEALAAGVPVVATRIAGVGELVEEGVSGELVPPGDVASLAGAVERLVNDADLRSRYGDAGRAKVVRDYNVAREAARLKGLFEAAVAGKKCEGRVRPLLPDESEADQRPIIPAEVKA